MVYNYSTTILKHVIFMSLYLVLTESLNISAIAQNITPYKTLRYQQTIGQTDIYTCGAAAVATLLTHFYKLSVSELEILEIAEKVMQISGKKPQDSGINALALKQSLIAKGIDADVRESTLEKIRNYFNRGGLPIVIHVTIPQPHYILAVGMVEDWLIVADPTLGRSMFPLETLNNQKGFSGIAIIARPSEQFEQAAKQQQQLSKDWASGRLQRFNAMKRNVL
ncbi:peptidase C39 bacteriocin processing [Pseudanabaena sp. FACHB-1998]|uniref:cysteine peptidase family C39 domain-containing protein n=1 Tax=Pseudanabaena sp. FACHB-1998 TaxID=2692858 RepID=UPI001680CF1C|nr:cysteine peptidase family C39 domain-containing protein [Pseudanabaena sp. FACHB-1998]MBD2179261.1 peptidase C39 bacteriocin processing [Pseudanabaena sp. FACHB-1998]